MNKKKIGEKTDSLLEAEMIKEAKMIEESLLGNAVNDFEISDEELDEAYQQFLKKMKAEGKLDEDKINEANSAKAMNNDTKTAESEVSRIPERGVQRGKFKRCSINRKFS